MWSSLNGFQRILKVPGNVYKLFSPILSMVRKKRPQAKTKRKSSGRKSKLSSSGKNNPRKFNIAWANFSMFIILFIISFLLYSFSTNALLRNFFGILSTVLGVLSFAFLVILVVLGIAKSGKKRR